jgi:hypothetical protein
MALNRPSDSTANLGDTSPYSGGGMLSQDVEGFLKHSSNISHTPCYVCKMQGQYKIIPKQDCYNTAELQRGLYICGNCLPSSPIDKSKYGIRPLSP